MLARSVAPETLGAAWSRHMRTGDFEAAWRVSDEVARLRAGSNCGELPRHHQWIWNGRSLRNKSVLVRCYHGLGDTIQFVRYLPLLRQLARKVTLWVQPELIPLLQTFSGKIDQLLPLHDGPPPCEYEADIELMELPYYFRSRLGDLPSEIPYFRVAPILLPGSKRNVGVIWRAGDWDERRSVPFHLIRKLAAECDQVSWYVLQRGNGLSDWNGTFGVNVGSDSALEAARVIAGLDLLITVDSMPAHLAGALGRPTWLLLPTDADWRWMENRADNPWYPTMRLFRQRRAGDWGSVISEVARSLREPR